MSVTASCLRVKRMLTGIQLIGCARVFLILPVVVSLTLTNTIDRLHNRNLTQPFINRNSRHQRDGDFVANTIRGRPPHDRISPFQRPEILYLHHLDLPLGLSGQALHHRHGLWKASDKRSEHLARDDL